MSHHGVWKVVWNRERVNTATGQVQVDEVPKVNISRSLGDFWSYCPRTGKYVVSPSPDIFVYELDLSQQEFLVVASDGLWDVMSPTEVVTFIYDYDKTLSVDVVTALIAEAICRWERKRLKADNVAVIVAFLSEESSSSAAPPPKRAKLCQVSTLSLQHFSIMNLFTLHCNIADLAWGTRAP